MYRKLERSLRHADGQLAGYILGVANAIGLASTYTFDATVPGFVLMEAKKGVEVSDNGEGKV